LEKTFFPPEDIERIKVALAAAAVMAAQKKESASGCDREVSSTPVLPLDATATAAPALAPQPDLAPPLTTTEQSVTLNPTTTPAPTPAQAPPVQATPASKLRVLIVDDSPSIQKILGRWFQRNDCEILSAMNGQLGVEAIQSSDPPVDIVFMDFLMPVMDGLEAVRTYYQWIDRSPQEISRKFLEVLIIGLSATANVEEQQEGIKVGMHYFIQKPADTKLLRLILDYKLQKMKVKEISEKLKAGVVL
jgi:CheY-like chemotaxis protein